MNAQEYNTCVKEQANALYRFACKSLGDWELAKDMVQQAFEVLWEKRDSVLPEKGKSFLFTVTHRRCLDYFRTKKREVSMEHFQENSSSETPDTNNLKQLLSKALSTLDTQSRNLVMLKDYEGYSYEEIANITHLSVTQVKVYLHRARKQLKNYLVNKEYIL